MDWEANPIASSILRPSVVDSSDEIVIVIRRRASHFQTVFPTIFYNSSPLDQSAYIFQLSLFLIFEGGNGHSKFLRLVTLMTNSVEWKGRKKGNKNFLFRHDVTWPNEWKKSWGRRSILCLTPNENESSNTTTTTLRRSEIHLQLLFVAFALLLLNFYCS